MSIFVQAVSFLFDDGTIINNSHQIAVHAAKLHRVIVRNRQKMNSDNVTPLIADAVVLAAAILNYTAALIWGPKDVPGTKTILRQLSGESRAFLKAQWPFVLFCMISASVFDCQSVNFDPGYFLSGAIALPLAGWLTLELSKMFYMSYLASARDSGLAFSVTLRRFIQYSLADTVRCFAVMFGTLFIVQPGIYLVVRTCLFLPIFIIERQPPWKAIQRSWLLTKGQYWLISRYLGPMVVFYCVIAFLRVFVAAQASVNSGAIACVSVASVVLELVLAGMIYKLYLQLVDDAATAPIVKPTASS